MADIKTHLNNIKGALYGKDVRGSIHDGIDAINKEVENTTGRQVDLENTFDQLIINAGNSNAEIVDARVKNDGTSYSKLGDRLDVIDSQLEHIPSFGYEYSVYKTLNDRQSDLYINVKDFGAKGDAVYCNYNEDGTVEGWYTDSSKSIRATDDTIAIQKAIDYAQNINNIPSRKAKVFLPRGGYFISSKLTSTSGVSFEGGGSLYPRYGRYNNVHLAQSTIICCDDNFKDECLIHFQSSNVGAENIEFVGNKKTIGIKFRSYGESDEGSMASNYYLKNITVTNHLIGIGIKEFSYGRLEYVYVSDNEKYGLHGITAGDTMLLNCNFSGNGNSLTDNSLLNGSAIYLDANCGNSTIIGGKIEYNRIGLSIHSQGIIVNSVQFDNNKFCNIRLHSNDIACSSIISNSRFLGGGYENIGNKQCASIILYGSPKSNYQFPIDLNISNCSFKTTPITKAVEYDITNVNTITKQLIRIDGEGLKRLNLSNNSINNSSGSVYDIYATSNDNERSYIKTDNFKVHTSFKGSVFHSGSVNTYFYENLKGTSSIISSFNYGDIITRSGYEYSVGTVTKWLCVRPGTTFNTDLSSITLTGVAGGYSVTSSIKLLDKLCAGDYIKIVESPKVFYKIVNIDYSTNVISLEQPLDTSINGASVKFAPPMWRVVEKVIE